MRRKKNLSFPALKNRKEDLNKLWYVEIGMSDPKTGLYERKRFYSLSNKDINVVINEKSTVEERYVEGQKIVDYLTTKIKRGWTIFDDPEGCVYYEESLIQYSNEAAVYHKKLTDNNIYEFLVSAYLKEKLPDWDDSTQVNYKGRYRRFGLWLIKNEIDKVDISAIDNHVIVNFFNYLKNEKDLTAKTYASYANLLKDFFDHLVEKGIIKNSPVHSLPANKNKKDMGAERIHKDHLVKLMQRIDQEDIQLAIVCRFEYFCALRPGQEIRFLKIRDIDFRRGHSKVRVNMKNAKTSNRREVTIPDVFLDFLLDHGIDNYPPDYYVIGRDGQPSPDYLGKNTIRIRFNKYRDDLGLPNENKLYSMKHTGGIALAESGEPLINIRDHFGHTSIATTEIYLKRHGHQSSKTIRQMGAMY